MPTRTSVRMSAGERREQLLDVAKAIVAEARASMPISIEGVAREAGISRPIVYGHFHDLPGCSRRWSRARAPARSASSPSVLPAALAEPRPRERLVGALGGYLEAVRADPGTWRLVLMPQRGRAARAARRTSRAAAAPSWSSSPRRWRAAARRRPTRSWPRGC